jgi:hypothetical protein
VSRSTRAGIAALVVGLALVIGVRLTPGLGGPPLYDGVVPVGPYQWLEPAPGQQGGAQGAKATVAVIGGQNDLVAVATPESLPQAQMLAVPGALVLPPGATRIEVSIEPVQPTVQPADGALGSNVYRFTLVDQSGAPLTPRASAKVSIVLRSADAALLTGVVERFDGSAWVPLKTAPPGLNGAYLAVVTAFGDYAVVKPGPASSSSAPPAASAGASAGGPTAPAATGTPQVASSGAAASPSAAASGAATPTATPSPADTGTSGGSGALLPFAVAAGIALLVFVVLTLAQGRSGPPPPPKAPYRGAHRLDDD